MTDIQAPRTVYSDPMGGLFSDPFAGTPRGEAIRLAAERTRKPMRGRIPGEVGVWVFIFGDLMAFGLFFIVFQSARMDEPGVFEASRLTLHLEFGAINTLLLLVGSLLVVRGIRAMRTGTGRAPLLFILTALCGLWFVINKIIEYLWVIDDGYNVGTNLFYGYYFLMTGAHLLHLVLALLGILVVIRISKREVHTAKDLRNVEAFGAYWHLVDLLWVILFPLIYLMRV
ncbi:MAG: cytochrome c oxidase subunit 3 [Sporichthyaceae bacterium]